MEFKVGEKVRVGKDDAHIEGRIVARVRADDDPRKCVPLGMGFKFVAPRNIPDRDEVSYLVRKDASRLIWTHGKKVVPTLPFPAVYNSANLPVLEDARSISSGTLSYLTGFIGYDDLSKIHREFVQHVIATAATVRYENWIDAWRWFINGHADRLPAYADPVDRSYTLATPGKAPDDAVASTGREFISRQALVVATAEELPLSSTSDALIRVGFVRKHWLIGRNADRFSLWAAQRRAIVAPNRSIN